MEDNSQESEEVLHHFISCHRSNLYLAGWRLWSRRAAGEQGRSTQTIWAVIYGLLHNQFWHPSAAAVFTANPRWQQHLKTQGRHPAGWLPPRATSSVWVWTRPETHSTRGERSRESLQQTKYDRAKNVRVISVLFFFQPYATLICFTEKYCYTPNKHFFFNFLK